MKKVITATRIKRVMRYVALTVFGTALTYLVAANLFLASGGFESVINDNQPYVTIEMGSAYTVWPFVIHASDLTVRIEDRAVQAYIAADEVEVDYHVTDMSNRLVHMTGVRGKGFVFRLRQNQPESAWNEETRRGLAPIPNAPPPVLQPDPNPVIDLSDNWNLKFDDVDIDAKEIWIDRYRLSGPIHLRGGYELRTENDFELSPTRIDLGGASVEIAALPAGEVTGSADVTIARSDVMSGSVAAWLEALELRTDLRATLDDAAALQPLTDPVAVTHGRGELTLHGAFAHGLVTKGSQLALEGSDLAVSYGTTRFRGGTTIVAEVRTDYRVAGRVGLTGNVFVGPLPPLTFTRAELDGSVDAAYVLAEPRAPEAKLALYGVLQNLAALRTDEVHVTRGRGALGTELELDPNGALAGSVSATLSDLALSWRDARFAGNAEARLFLRGNVDELELANMIGRVTVDAQHFGGDDGGPLRAELLLKRLSGDPRQGNGDATLSVSSLSPVMSLRALDEAVPDVLEAFVDLDDLRAAVVAIWNDSGAMLRVSRAETEGATMSGHLVFDDGPLVGAMKIKVGPFVWGIAITPKGVDVTLGPGKKWNARFFERALRRFSRDQVDPPGPAK